VRVPAATFLTVEVCRPGAARRLPPRALSAAVAVGGMALLAFLLAADGAPRVREACCSPLELAISSGDGGGGAGRAGRALVAPLPPGARAGRGAAVLVLLGWALGAISLPVVPDLTIAGPPPAARPAPAPARAGRRPAVLLPSLLLLFRVFQAARRTRALAALLLAAPEAFQVLAVADVTSTAAASATAR